MTDLEFSIFFFFLVEVLTDEQQKLTNKHKFQIIFYFNEKKLYLYKGRGRAQAPQLSHPSVFPSLSVFQFCLSPLEFASNLNENESLEGDQLTQRKNSKTVDLTDRQRFIH